MSAPLKREQRQIEEKNTVQYSPKYREFQELNTTNAKFRELVFFARIAAFSITTVLACFILLVFHVDSFLAFPIAMLIGVAMTSTLFYFILSMSKK